ncbi:hypothetical protein SASPL_141449 [Salvia splendens]|uniref:Uncharacterized protein n=1 Tax=Salvia splendens TaxID=180675 RepID=A0A8X8WU16_SALSN|nr:hypothetical protein SASPL_141449 [Salvia splendens]
MSPSSLAAVDRAAVVVYSARRLTMRSSSRPSAWSSCLTAAQFSSVLKHAPMFLSFFVPKFSCSSYCYWPLGCTKQLICLWHCSASTLALQFFS